MADSEGRGGQGTIRVGSLIRDLLAHVLYARRDVPSSRLRVECLSPVAPKPFCERGPCGVDVVCCAFAFFQNSINYLEWQRDTRPVGPRVITVEILVHVKHQTRGGAIGVDDGLQCVGGSAGDERPGGRPVVAGEKQDLSCGAVNWCVPLVVVLNLLDIEGNDYLPGVAYGCYRRLNRRGPERDVRDIVRLVHSELVR